MLRTLQQSSLCINMFYIYQNLIFTHCICLKRSAAVIMCSRAAYHGAVSLSIWACNKLNLNDWLLLTIFNTRQSFIFTLRLLCNNIANVIVRAGTKDSS